ncbi:hypothetical protein C5C13_11730 [Clavibacter michiganensis]|nr:hypothetical protein C5C13_11730 [Clavibacter michiganensis]
MQFVPDLLDVHGNIERTLLLTQEALDAGARLVVFPELSLTGYRIDGLGTEDWLVPDDPRLEPLRRLVAAVDAMVVVGAPVQTGGRRYIASLVLTGTSPDVIAPKSHLHGGEFDVFDAGEEAVTHLEAGYWRIQVEDRPVLGYVIRHRAELRDPFTFEVYADARNDQGQRIWIRREHSLNTAVAWMVQHSAELITFAAHSRSGSRGPAETTAAEHASAYVDQAREFGHVERGQLG